MESSKRSRNPIAKQLRTPKFRSRRLKNKVKYTRKAKHKDDLSYVHEYSNKE